MRGVLLLLLAGLLAPLAASAQPSAGGSSLVAPRLRSSTDVAYPPGAEGSASVTLRLRIDGVGNVVEVSVLAGEEPFASAAAQEARRFRFDPATRGGAPVASYVRFQVRFEPPVAPAPGSSAPAPDTSSPPASTPGPAAKIEAEDEVTVAGSKAAAGATRMTRAEVRQLPGAFGDPFRAIEALPGVTPLISGAPFFYVRGAPPGNVGYFLDGVRVPYLFHVFLGPSVVNPTLVQQVDLHPGGYPARFGRFAGGIVAGETTPPLPEPHGEAVLRLFDAGAMVEAPWAQGRGSAMVGGRYSYSALLFSLFSPAVTLDYWDYQGRLSYRVSPTATVTLFAFGARDFLGEKRGDEEKTFFDTRFHRLDLRYDDDLGGRGASRLAVTLGLDRTGDGEDRLQDRSVALRSQNTRRVGAVTLGFGADVSFSNAEGRSSPVEDSAEASQRVLFRTRQDLVQGAYLDAAIPVGGVVFTPGLRADLYATSGGAQPGLDGPAGRSAALSVEPRLAIRAPVGKRLWIIHTVGSAQQPPSFVVPLPGFRPDPLRGGLQRSVQVSAGVEAELGAGFTGTATLFRSVFSNLSDALGTRPVDLGGPDVFESRAQGSATGLEVQVKRSLTRRLGGYLSYTLSRSLRSQGRATFPSSFDRTHVASGALGYEVARGWRAGVRFQFYTGAPQFELRPVPRLTASPARAPSFHRIDLRAERQWRVGERGRLALVFEFLNATLRKETFGQSCDATSCKAETVGPIFVPSLGVEGQW